MISFLLRLRLVGLVGFAFCLTGCLDFEKQTVLVVFPTQGTEIKILMIYEGLKVGGGTSEHPDKSLNRAKNQLADLVAGKAFYLGNPLIRVNLDDPAKDQDPGLQLILKHVAITKGFFITDKNGAFTYCQPMTIREPGKLIEGCNRLLCEAWSRLQAPPAPIWDDETFRLVQQAAKNGHAWLRLEPGRLSYTMPGTPRFFTQLKREILGSDRLDKALQDLEKSQSDPDRAKADVENLRNLQFLLAGIAENPWSLDLRRNSMTFSVGYGQGEPIQLTTPAKQQPSPPKELSSKLLAHARTLRVPIVENGTVEKVLEDFRQQKK